MRGLKALVATRNGVGGARAHGGTHWWPELAREILENVASLDASMNKVRSCTLSRLVWLSKHVLSPRLYSDSGEYRGLE